MLLVVVGRGGLPVVNCCDGVLDRGAGEEAEIADRRGRVVDVDCCGVGVLGRPVKDTDLTG